MAVVRETQLLIKARDEASAALNTVAKAFETLATAQADAKASGSGAASSLTGVATAIATLEAASGKIGGAFTKSEDAIQGQRSSLKALTADLEAMKRQQEAAAVAIVQASIKAKGASLIGGTDASAAKQELLAAQQGYAALGREIGTLEKRLARQTVELGKGETALTEIRNSALAAELALKDFGDTGERSSLKARAAAEQVTAELRQQETAASEAARALETAAAAQRRFAEQDSPALLRGKSPIDAQTSAFNRADFSPFGTVVSDKQKEAIDLAEKQLAIERAMVAEANNLRAALNPLAQIEAKHAAELEKVRRLLNAGKIGAKEFADAEKLLAQRAKEAADHLNNTGRGGGAGAPSLFGLRPYELTNLGYQINDLVTQVASGTSVMQAFAQQGGQILQLMPNIATKMLGIARNPWALALVGGAVVATAGIVALGNELDRVRNLQGKLALNVDTMGLNAKGILEAAKSLREFGVSADEAAGAAASFASKGLDESYFVRLTKAAQQVADVTGKDMTDAVDDAAGAFTRGYDAVKELDEKLNFLTATELAHIKVLFEQGDAEAARTEAMGFYIAKAQEAADAQNGPWKKATDNLSASWASLLDRLKDTSAIKTAVSALEGLANILGAISGRTYAASTVAGVDVQIAAAKTSVQELEAALKRVNSVPFLPSMFGLQFDQLNKARLETDLATAQQKLNTLTAARKTLLTQNNEAASEGVKITERQKKVDADLASETKKRAAQDKALTAEQRKQVAYKEAYAQAVNKGASAEGAKSYALGAQAAVERQIAKEREQAAKRLTSETAKKAREEERAAKAREKGMTVMGRPVDGGTVRSTPGYRTDPITGKRKYHAGTDYAVPIGTPVKAMAEGTVIKAESSANGANGRYIKLDHGNGTTTAYLHLDKVEVSVGDTVGKGEVIGKSGNTGRSTGPHLHTEIRRGGKPVVDPSREVPTNPGEAEIDYYERQMDFNEALLNEDLKRQQLIKTLTSQKGLQGEALLAVERQGAIEAAIAEKRAQAADKDLTISAEQIEAIKQTTGQLFDLENAAKKADIEMSDLERKVNDLENLESSLVDQAAFYSRRGQTDMVDEVNAKLTETETKLATARQAFLDYWEAVKGDPAKMVALNKTPEEIDVIIGSLKTAETQAEQMRKRFLMSAEDINVALSEKIAGAFDQFAQRVADGENVFKAFGRTFALMALDFLKQIAMMIIQQMIFNAVSGGAGGEGGGGAPAGSGGAGASIGGFIAGLFHKGGLVSGGGEPRLASATWFDNAQKYHGGGGPKLMPGEVAAVLKDTEEVLTDTDPRHIKNLGRGGGQQAQSVKAKIVNVLDPADIVTQGLATEVGEQVLINFMSRNRRAISQALQGSRG